MTTMETSTAFAQVNDSIRGLARQVQSEQTWEFFCECPDVTCHELVTLTLVEFDARREASPALPVLASYHDA